MLSEKEVKEMAELFFNGKPEEAYAKVSLMSEWDQFINSIRKDSNQVKAYHIMAKSDLSIWEKNTPFTNNERLPRYDIGY